MIGNFANIGRAAGVSPIWQISKHHEFIISMTKLNWIHILNFSISTSYSLAKVQSCHTFNQNLMLLLVFSFSFFVKAKCCTFCLKKLNLSISSQIHATADLSPRTADVIRSLGGNQSNVPVLKMLQHSILIRVREEDVRFFVTLACT